MKIASVQMEMHWTLAENIEEIVDNIARAAGLGAELVVFPELAITGSHRRIREECEEIARSDWQSKVGQACNQHGVAAFVGAPRFGDEGVFDGYCYFDSSGRFDGETHKNGLTPSEQTFFKPGSGRARWDINGRQVGVVICREIVDLPELQRDLGDDTDLLLWPCVSSVNDIPPEEEQVNREQAMKVAQAMGSQLVQANWANSVNRPELDNTGGSVVISDKGQSLLTCPLREPGLALVDFENNSFTWHKATNF